MRTMSEYTSAIITRANRYAVGLELDHGTIELLVNRARRDVQLATMPLYPERYGRDVIGLNFLQEKTSFETDTAKVFEGPLPADFTDMAVVQVKHCPTDTPPDEDRPLEGTFDGRILLPPPPADPVGKAVAIWKFDAGEEDNCIGMYCIGAALSFEYDSDNPTSPIATVTEVQGSRNPYNLGDINIEKERIDMVNALEPLVEMEGILWGDPDEPLTLTFASLSIPITPVGRKTYNFALGGWVTGTVKVSIDLPDGVEPEGEELFNYMFGWDNGVDDPFGTGIRRWWHIAGHLGSLNDHVGAYLLNPSITPSSPLVSTEFICGAQLDYDVIAIGMANIWRDETKGYIYPTRTRTPFKYQADSSYILNALSPTFVLTLPQKYNTELTDTFIPQIDQSVGLRVGGRIIPYFKTVPPQANTEYHAAISGKNLPFTINFLDSRLRYDSTPNSPYVYDDRPDNVGMFGVVIRGVNGAVDTNIVAGFEGTIDEDGNFTGVVTHINDPDKVNGTVSGTISPLAQGIFYIDGETNGSSPATGVVSGAINGNITFTLNGTDVAFTTTILGSGEIVESDSDDGEEPSPNPCCWFAARRVDIREFWNVVNNTWAGARPQSPLYAIDRPTSSNETIIYLSKGLGSINPDDVRFFYYPTLAYLQTYNTATGQADVDMKTGFHYEELVIQLATYRCLLKFSLNNEVMAQVAEDIENYVQMLQESAGKMIDQRYLLLPSRENMVHAQPIVNQNPVPNGTPTTFLPVR